MCLAWNSTIDELVLRLLSLLFCRCISKDKLIFPKQFCIFIFTFCRERNHLDGKLCALLTIMCLCVCVFLKLTSQSIAASYWTRPLFQRVQFAWLHGSMLRRRRWQLCKLFDFCQSISKISSVFAVFVVASALQLCTQDCTEKITVECNGGNQRNRLNNKHTLNFGRCTRHFWGPHSIRLIERNVRLELDETTSFA